MTTPKRGAVIIAVKKTGQLPELQTVHQCAQQMSTWALAQGFPKKLVKVITDEKKPVDAKQIRDAVANLVKEDGIEQIIVYFAGHGVVNGGELWLLSGAPDDVNEAVNLEGSILLARSAGIPHVVFISDACRTAAEGIRGTRVKGQDIFPNAPLGEQPVDVFFACGLGSPSNEIKDPKNSAKIYKSVYTDALLVGLEGRKTDLIEELEDGDDIVGLVRPKPLRDYLVTELKERLKDVKTEEGPLNQVPYARLESQGEKWMARFAQPRASRVKRGGGKVKLRPAPSFQPAGDAHSVAQKAVRSVLSDQLPEATKQIATALKDQVSHVSIIEESIERTQTPFGPAHFETNCGFKVRGNKIVAVDVAGKLKYSLFENLLGELHSPSEHKGSAVRLDPPLPKRAASVLLEFKTGVGLVLPAIPGFIAAIEFDKSELVGVSYEPSDRSGRWPGYVYRLDEFRALRGLITASARMGTLTFEGAEASDLARQMQIAKNGDPFMAVYAAYAYHQLGRWAWLREMYQYQFSDLGFRLFDLALLTRELYNKNVIAEQYVYPMFPMLSQGWTLLSAYQVKLPERLALLRDHLVPSIWTLLDKSGIEIARKAIESGVLR